MTINPEGSFNRLPFYLASLYREYPSDWWFHRVLFLFAPRRYRQQGVGRWWRTVHNVVVQQRARVHAAEEYFTRSGEGFHSGKKASSFSRVRGYAPVYWIGKWSSGNIGGTFKNPSRFVEEFIAGIFDETLRTSYIPLLLLSVSLSFSLSHSLLIPSFTWSRILKFYGIRQSALSSDLITFNLTAGYWLFYPSACTCTCTIYACNVVPRVESNLSFGQGKVCANVNRGSKESCFWREKLIKESARKLKTVEYCCVRCRFVFLKVGNLFHQDHLFFEVLQPVYLLVLCTKRTAV